MQSFILRLPINKSNYRHKKIPFLISTGGLKSFEKDQLLNLLPKDRTILMHCVSSYPSQPNEQFLDTITEYVRNGFVTGFSTHENGFTASLISAALGAKFIERHITLSNASIGFDHVKHGAFWI